MRAWCGGKRYCPAPLGFALAVENRTIPAGCACGQCVYGAEKIFWVEKLTNRQKSVTIGKRKAVAV